VNNDITLPLTGYIELTRGAKTLVDWEDLEWLNQWLWICSSRGYAVRSYRCKDKLGEKQLVSMHRAIMERHGYCIEGKEIDHINRDRLCNIKSNLRVATKSQNLINSSRRSHNTSGIAGVYYNKKRDKWEAHLGLNSKRIVLGVFSNKEDAISARKIGLIKYFGEYANLDENHSKAFTALPIKTTKTEYATRKKYTTNTGHSGISWQEKTSCWVAYIKLDNKRVNLGNFNSIEDAKSLREQALQKVAAGNFIQWIEQTRRNRNKNTGKSGQFGILWDKRRSKWTVLLPLDGERKRFGSYSTIEDAIAARDKAIKENNLDFLLNKR